MSRATLWSGPQAGLARSRQFSIFTAGEIEPIVRSMADPLASIGKGIVQINLRLNRVIELLERPETGKTGETGETGASERGEQVILFDLLDALSRALERPAPPPRRSWLARLTRAEPPDEGLRAGLVVARERALEHLRRRGIDLIDTHGRFDPELHEALERVPPQAGSAGLPGMIAATHRRGFISGEGGERRVLRLAQVSVYSESIAERAG